MPSRLLLSSLLIIQHLQLDTHANVIPNLSTLTKNPPSYDCAFTLGGYEYDLCPLNEVTVEVGDVVFDTRGECDRGYCECDDNNWACAADPAFETVRIDQAGAGVQGTAIRMRPWAEVMATLLEAPEVDVDRREHIVDIGSPGSDGAFTQAKRMLRLFFENDETNSSSGFARHSVYVDIRCSVKHEHLNVKRNQDGSYTFLWDTLHGCPLRLARMSAQDEQQDQESPDETTGDDELMPIETSKTRRWIASIVIILSLTLTCAYVLVSSPRARHFITEHFKTVSSALFPAVSHVGMKLRPLAQSLTVIIPKSVERLGARFRRGESQLVRWAQEDMSLDSGDVMVNGDDAQLYDAEGWNADELNEYIPLTFRLKGVNGFVRSYGSTPDVETFEERGPTSGFGRLFRK